MSTVLTLSSIARVQSTLHPGVIYVTRKRTDKRRIELRLKLADATARLDEILTGIRAFGDAPHKDIDPETITAEQVADRARWVEDTTPLINDYNELLDDVIHPAWIEWGLHRIEGLEIEDAEGKPQKITGKNAGELLPGELLAEALEAVKDTAELGGKRAGNSESRTTSDAAADTRTPDTTAASANELINIGLVTAAATSPAK